MIRQSCPLQVPFHVHRNTHSTSLPCPAVSQLTSSMVLATRPSLNEVSPLTAHHGPRLLPPLFHLLTLNIPHHSSLCYPPAGASLTSVVALATPPSSSEASPLTVPSWCTTEAPSFPSPDLQYPPLFLPLLPPCRCFTDFSRGAGYAAFIKRGLAFNGPIVVYSWPTVGRPSPSMGLGVIKMYRKDEESSMRAGADLHVRLSRCWC